MRSAFDPGQSGSTRAACETASRWLSRRWREVANLRGGIFRWALAGRALEGGHRIPPFNTAWGLLLPRALRHEVTA